MTAVSTSLPNKLRSCTVWLLVLGFLYQPILSYLVTPMTVSDRHGMQVLVCTLKGSQQEVFVDLPPISGEQAPMEDCSAIKLFQLAGTVQISLPQTAPQLSLYSVGMLDQTVAQQHHKLHFSAYSSRAPPLA